MRFLSILTLFVSLLFAAPVYAADEITNPNKIIAAQKILFERYFLDHAPNGIPSWSTRMAIQKFEEAEGLPKTGNLTTAMYKRLNKKRLPNGYTHVGIAVSAGGSWFASWDQKSREEAHNTNLGRCEDKVGKCRVATTHDRKGSNVGWVAMILCASDLPKGPAFAGSSQVSAEMAIKNAHDESYYPLHEERCHSVVAVSTDGKVVKF